VNLFKAAENGRVIKGNHMDEVERQDEYDANVEAIKAALEGCSQDELRHIAATQIVNGLYLESAHKREVEALYNTITLKGAAMRRAGLVHLAELDQHARDTVRHLIRLMPEMQGKARSQNAKAAADARYEDDPTQEAKAAIKAEWLRLRETRGKARWFAKFARDQQKTYSNLLDEPETIRKWIVAWEKEYASAEQKV
jgi:hypothetical protein